MDEQRARRGGGPLRAWGGPPAPWRPGGWQGPPWWNRRDGGNDDDTSPAWPWRSTLLLTVFVLIGSNFAAHAQPDREPLHLLGRLLLLAGSGLLLWRHRHPALVVFGTA